MCCRDASFNAYSLYLAPQFFSRNYYLHLISANIYVSVPDININDIAFVSWIARVDLSRFSRQFGKIVPRGRAQAASRPFAPAIIVTGVTIRGRRRVLARERHARVHSSAFTGRHADLSPFRAARFHHGHDS